MVEDFTPPRDTRRIFLKRLGLFAGAAAGGLLENHYDQKEVEPVVAWEGFSSAEEKVIHFATTPGGFATDALFKKNAEIDVDGFEERPRHEFVKEFFATNPARNLPPTIQTILAEYATGIPAHESRYDNTALNEGAHYAWQIRQGVLTDLNKNDGGNTLSFDDLKDFTVGTETAFRYFDEELYPVIAEPATVCAQHFGLSEAEKDIFTTLCLINSYTVGGQGMKEVINTFMTAWEHPDSPSEVYDLTGISLFNVLTEQALIEDYRTGYEAHSSEYVFKVLAGAAVLSTGIEAEADTEPPASYPAEELIESAAAGVAGGIAGHLLGSAVAPAARRINTDPNALRDAGRAIAASAMIGAGTPAVVEGNLPDFRDLWREERLAVAPIIETDNTSQATYEALNAFYEQPGQRMFSAAVYNDPSSETDTTSQYELLLSILDADKTYRDNYAASGYLREFVAGMQDGTLPRFTSEEAMNQDDSPLVAVPARSRLWRARGIGLGQVAATERDNNEAMLRLRPEALTALEELAQRFQTELARKGLSDRWSIRLNINSLTRLIESGVSGQSNHSAHTTGSAFDVAYHFDLIDNQTGSFAQLNPNNPVTKHDTAIIHTALLALFSAAKEMHDEGAALITLEGNTPFYEDRRRRGAPPHLHIVVKPEN